MLRPRIIPCLLLKDGGLVKTVRFGNPKYVGDPINAVRIFNEKGVDELIVADIDATARNREPDYSMIRDLAAECRMPLCYAGGIKTVDQAQRIIGMGVEKVAIGSAAIQSPELISQAASKVGSQSIVVVLDVKRTGIFRRHEVFIHNGTKATSRSPTEFAAEMERSGAGELLVNSIDNDGVMSGYDEDLIAAVRRVVNLPITALGGAGSQDDIARLVNRFGAIGAAAGSLFVFKGKYRAVLINYPTLSERDAIIGTAPIFREPAS